jgi:hypothetical protein
MNSGNAFGCRDQQERDEDRTRVTVHSHEPSLGADSDAQLFVPRSAGSSAEQEVAEGAHVCLWRVAMQIDVRSDVGFRVQSGLVSSASITARMTQSGLPSFKMDCSGTVLFSQFVSIGKLVLACFDPYWPILTIEVACFRF